MPCTLVPAVNPSRIPGSCRHGTLLRMVLLVLLSGVAGCAWSARAGGAGTVRDLTELGAEGEAEVSAGGRCGRGVCLAGARVTGGFFGRSRAGSAAGKLEYLWFFGRNAGALGVSWGPRVVGEETGHVVSIHLSAFEPFPSGRPAGSIGAGMVAGFGFGDEAVRGGWFGVGVFWEFSDIFSWK
ncbi:MAG: hypothetical protein CVU65_06705 [Deltaproteobacteria bacterium HGW-Deltaproteobacteria-22]|nr:MAG: hypothetical protein CVU65_06705 [Deltaproteobacteria bacterium HGW-Deltaproteobacteria-22]